MPIAKKLGSEILTTLLGLSLLLMPLANAVAVPAPPTAYQVLAPLTQDNLTIFPVVSNLPHETGKFLTLDEGLSTGQVIVTEAGRSERTELLRGDQLLRPQRENDGVRPRFDGAEVNRLVLINKSELPLLLLAGEIITGGKQDRVVGKDRIVPAHSAPVDLSVFCVEPGRWVATSSNFGGLKAQMAQPSVRRGAMAAQSQTQVWDEVRATHRAMVAGVPAAPPLASTSSYAGVMASSPVSAEINRVAQPLERSYERLIKELRDRHAVGVVVAVNGRVIWADVFANTSLLEKYWPKLVRSYAAEAVVARASTKLSPPSQDVAQRFLAATGDGLETMQTEPGVYRQREVEGNNYRTFELTSLLPGMNYVVHLAKMTAGPAERGEKTPASQTREPIPLVRPQVVW
jgi:hypothetical protein